jgi:hypothetical protein
VVDVSCRSAGNKRCSIHIRLCPNMLGSKSDFSVIIKYSRRTVVRRVFERLQFVP